MCKVPLCVFTRRVEECTSTRLGALLQHGMPLVVRGYAVCWVRSCLRAEPLSANVLPQQRHP